MIGKILWSGAEVLMSDIRKLTIYLSDVNIFDIRYNLSSPTKLKFFTMFTQKTAVYNWNQSFR